MPFGRGHVSKLLQSISDLLMAEGVEQHRSTLDAVSDAKLERLCQPGKLIPKRLERNAMRRSYNGCAYEPRHACTTVAQCNFSLNGRV